MQDRNLWLSLGIIIFLVQAWIFVQLNNQVFGYSSVEVFPREIAGKMLNVYQVFLLLQVMTQVVLLYQSRKAPTFEDVPITMQMKRFILGFGLYSIVLYILPRLPLGSVVYIPLEWSIGITHALVIAYVEELLFREALWRQWGDSTRAMIIRSLLFGAFHFSIFGANIVAGVLMALLGFSFEIMRKHGGFMTAWGAHTGLNFAGEGLLIRFFGG